ncbi:hypothetical protein AMAG_01591 [Allomyces macrogynus ATCC 38327]|uniref:Sucrase/ferredoxin-like-domain-containing protein n=1 Tax=Allomyces macrogynus (strain ATCC 38327) TaxID=578462 RepID=A0A0L0RZ64_ALLM3|nr:hypothetical protein AMAG_01591 [Allomyces macrogynus ATCC 38327]|eukprot:KNE55712.1 hypothetical protein AMAG_01591 [Allomyces macrogynus ATCC 38327]
MSGIFNTLKSVASSVSLRSLVNLSRRGSLQPSDDNDACTFPSSIDFTDACAACDNPCPEHAAYSARTESQLDKTSTLAGSIKPYTHHLILCTGNAAFSWASHIDADSKLAAKIDDVASSLKGTVRTARSGANTPVGRVVVTACDRPRSNPAVHFDAHGDEVEAVDILVFPDHVMITDVTIENAEQVLTHWFQHNTLPPAPTGASFAPRLVPVEHKHHVLICAHKKRDSRCGESGPILIREFHRVIDRDFPDLHDQVAVYGTSHIGGHKFAGTLIMYPSGDWYGRVHTCDVTTLVKEQVRGGRTVKKLWRGRGLPLGKSGAEEGGKSGAAAPTNA